MIRDATAQDIPACLEMGAKFHALAGMPVPFDPPTFVELLGTIIRARTVLVLTNNANEPVGMIGMIVLPAYYNANVLNALEVFWWIEPEYRGRGGKMIDALEKRAKQMNVPTLQLSCLETMKEVGILYERKGYKLMDHNYVKVL